MFKRIKWCVATIGTIVLLFLFCKIATDLSMEAGRIRGVDTFDYGYENMSSDFGSERSIQDACDKIEDMALRSISQLLGY